MGLYAYCVVPPDHRPEASLTGLNGSQVELHTVGNLGVWVTRSPRPESVVDNISIHNAVVEAAVTQEVTPVPLRFGQWLEDDGKLAESMAGKAVAYAEKLREFAGCLEFGIRIIDPREPAKATDPGQHRATSGLAYMQALRESSKLEAERLAEVEGVRVRVHEALQGVVRDERVEDRRTPHAVITLSHLVARTHFDEYRERARQLREIFPALRLLLSGPWPPYSFAA